MASLSINGTRISGQQVRDENASAVTSLSNAIRTSLGPAGLDKMVVDDVGEVTVTNDGATILKLIELNHPAAKLLVDLAQLQDKEVGDGTTSVVLLAAELIRRGNSLIRSGIHPTTVISGFQQARKASCKFIAENLSYKIETLGDESLLAVARTTMSSKSIGQEEEHFSKITLEAAKSVLRVEKGKRSSVKCSVSDVGIVKVRGDSLLDSELLHGVAFERGRTMESFGMPSKLDNVKVVFIDFDLRKEKLPFNAKIVCEDPKELEAMRAQETSAIEHRVSLLLKSGARAILSARSIDDFALDIVSRAGAMALKNVPRAALKRAANAAGARLLSSLASLDAKDGAEKVPSAALGVASLSERKVNDASLLFQVLPAKRDSRCATLLLKGPNDAALDEAERAVHDVLCALKRVLESNRVVVGGGVVEAALSVYLENFAETIGSREQLAIAEFAEALLWIPKTLATNGALDSLKLVSGLRAAHTAVIRDGDSELKAVGLELEKGKLRDNLKAGVLEPAMSKIKSIKFATEAAVAILRIDDSIFPPEGAGNMAQARGYQ